ncbi:uncharacterized protein LOC114246997 [Bombyx mandarina]|uniref:Uncharacterized protein LOC114246997 n=1 Tax=Bombyx mandarina TaxID=7092 RepID=A0A6J2K3L9_BOMMA|nr:uncharacterized protein LOC114246997 [Bombyx mandarina]
MADRGKHRVAPVPAPARKQYAYVPCPRSEEVGTEFALQLLKNYHDEPETPRKIVHGGCFVGSTPFNTPALKELSEDGANLLDDISSKSTDMTELSEDTDYQ